jgi:Tol biopolymer transport system component
MQIHVAYLLGLFLLLSSSTWAQLRTVDIQKLPLDKTKGWTSPSFSPDGRKVYLTTSGFHGIWEFTLASRSIRQITDDEGSGFGFVVSGDGKQLVYRTSTSDENTHERLQEIILVDITSRNSRVLDSGETVSTPVFVNNRVVYTVGSRTKNLPSQSNVLQTSIIGIEKTKIALSRNGKKVLLDPLQGGSYVWPSLSPDGKRIVAYDMEAGTFICDLDGKVLSRLGRRDAPTWTRDGKWIVFIRDADDGHDITSSDIWCISADGKTLSPLTETDSAIELYPDCSPTDDNIVYATLDGEIFLMSYEEANK